MKRTIITLALAAVAFASTMAHGQDDHGNTRQTATAVALPSETTGTINPVSDIDYFRFTVADTMSIVIETTGSYDPLGELWDSSGMQLRLDDSSSKTYRLRFFSHSQQPQQEIAGQRLAPPWLRASSGSC